MEVSHREMRFKEINQINGDLLEADFWTKSLVRRTLSRVMEPAVLEVGDLVWVQRKEVSL